MILTQGKLKVINVCSCHVLVTFNGLHSLSFTIKMSEFMATQDRNNLIRERLMFYLIVSQLMNTNTVSWSYDIGPGKV